MKNGTSSVTLGQEIGNKFVTLYTDPIHIYMETRVIKWIAKIAIIAKLRIAIAIKSQFRKQRNSIFWVTIAIAKQNNSIF